MANNISNMDDVIDSRDIIERIEELTNDLESLQSDYDDANEEAETAEKTENFQYDAFGNTLQELMDARSATAEKVDAWNNSDDGKELRTLQALAEECEGLDSDWQYGEALIRYDYFEQYQDELIADCYELPKDLPFWMTVVYDYDALKRDYAEVDFDGVIYFIRSV